MQATNRRSLALIYIQVLNPRLSPLITPRSPNPHAEAESFAKSFHLQPKSQSQYSSVTPFLHLNSKSSLSQRFDAHGTLEQSRYTKEIRSMGFTDETVNRLTEELPLSVLNDLSGIRYKVEILKSTGFSTGEIDRILYNFPGYFGLGIENKLRPLSEEFYELGFTRNEIKSEILENPELIFCMELGALSRCVGLLNSLKCRRPIKERILINGYLNAAIDVKLRIDCLHRHGLTLRDSFKVLYVEPRAILYSLEDIERKIEFLLNKMKFRIEHLVEFPEYLGVNLEKRIIPRYNVFEYLRSIGGLGDEIWMKDYVKLSKLKFYNMFVKPYPECEKIFVEGSVREKEERSCRPTGMWKLFKPEKFLKSKEDIKNMKEFMKYIR